jgi:hypothetical protein
VAVTAGARVRNAFGLDPRGWRRSTEGRSGRIVSDDGASPSGSGGASVLVEEPAEDVTTFGAVTWVAGDSRHSSNI